MRQHYALRAAVAALGMLAVMAYAAQDQKQGQLSKEDRSFVMDAAQGGMKEVQMGKLAQEKGQSEGVKAFGKRLEADHSKANEQLKAIADSNGVKLPASMDKKHQAVVDKFSKMKGEDFDRSFAKNMVDDHKEDLSKFRKEAQKGQNSELKQFASQTVPTLEEHLKMAQDLSGASGKSTGKGRK